jgi:hypothetical protein
MRVLIDGKCVHNLSNGETVRITVEPGEHELKFTLFLFSNTNRVLWEDRRKYEYNIYVNIIGQLKFSPIS